MFRRADDLFGLGVLSVKYQLNDFFLAVVEEANDFRRRWFFFGLEMIGGENLVARADLFDRLRRAVRHEDLGSGDEADFVIEGRVLEHVVCDDSALVDPLLVVRVDIVEVKSVVQKIFPGAERGVAVGEGGGVQSGLQRGVYRIVRRGEIGGFGERGEERVVPRGTPGVVVGRVGGGFGGAGGRGVLSFFGGESGVLEVSFTKYIPSSIKSQLRGNLLLSLKELLFPKGSYSLSLFLTGTNSPEFTLTYSHVGLILPLSSGGS